MGVLLAIIAALSIWDYPQRQNEHDRLRRQFVVAVREGDTETMIETSRKGVKLLPDDPTWRFNLACSLSYLADKKQALDELEKAIDLGFRDADAIVKDNDMKRLVGERRFHELVEYAREIRGKPILVGPLAHVVATGVSGGSVALGEQNLAWNFDYGCFDAKLKLVAASAGGNTGDLYVNRDAGHSNLRVADFPGITVVKLDKEGRDRKLDTSFPNMLFPYPVFGNCSMGFFGNAFWRSIPRALVTTEMRRLRAMEKFYLSNQTWVFPSNTDTAPVGTNGDVFASITPYWIVTAGRSFSDRPYLKGALEASRSLRPEVKKEIVRRGMLAPVVQTLVRKSLFSVSNEADYVSAKAHPTALPPNGLDVPRLAAAAASLTVEQIPPLAVVAVKPGPVDEAPVWPELVYAMRLAWAYTLRTGPVERFFTIKASGAAEFEFACTHGMNAAKVRKIGRDVAEVVLDQSAMGPTNRVYVAVFGRNPGTGWGAPSYVSFSKMDPSAPYSDPFFTVLSDAKP